MGIVLDLHTKIRAALSRALRRRSKEAFIESLPRRSRLLDVGCGNDSPLRIKVQRPDLTYVGLDIADHRQSADPRVYADQYVLVTPERYAERITAFAGQFDAVICSHSLEHCFEPDAVLTALLRALAPGGRLYLSFPCQESANFPHRHGSCNFFDDPTHHQVPDYERVLRAIATAPCEIEFAVRRYKPRFLALVGFVLEPISAVMKRNIPGGATWAYYGFESVIWARQNADGASDCEKNR